MKIFKVVVMVIFLVAFSCKKDKSSETIDPLLGHWHVLSFEPDNSSDNALLAKEVIANLVGADCHPIEYTFASGGKVTYYDKMSSLIVTEGENGAEVDCIFEEIFKDGTFDLNNNLLTLNFDDETVTVEAVVSGDTLTITIDNIIFNEATISGKVLFAREIY